MRKHATSGELRGADLSGNRKAMSFEQIKAESTALTAEQRRELIGHLLALGRKDDADFRRKLAAKIDDNDPSHWVTEDDLDRALGLDRKDS